MPVLAETGSQRTDIYQIVGMDNNQVRYIMILFIHMYIQQIQLKIFSKQVFYVKHVAVISSFCIVNDDERIFITVGCRKYLCIIPTAYSCAYIGDA